MRYAWDMHFKAKLQEFEAKASKYEKWYIGYLTIADFFLYTLSGYIEKLFPYKLASFPAIRTIANDFRKIKEIEQYEKSSRAVI